MNTNELKTEIDSASDNGVYHFHVNQTLKDGWMDIFKAQGLKASKGTHPCIPLILPLDVLNFLINYISGAIWVGPESWYNAYNPLI